MPLHVIPSTLEACADLHTAPQSEIERRLRRLLDDATAKEEIQFLYEHRGGPAARNLADALQSIIRRWGDWVKRWDAAALSPAEAAEDIRRGGHGHSQEQADMRLGEGESGPDMQGEMLELAQELRAIDFAARSKAVGEAEAIRVETHRIASDLRQIAAQVRPIPTPAVDAPYRVKHAVRHAVEWAAGRRIERAIRRGRLRDRPAIVAARPRTCHDDQTPLYRAACTEVTGRVPRFHPEIAQALEAIADAIDGTPAGKTNIPPSPKGKPGRPAKAADDALIAKFVAEEPKRLRDGEGDKEFADRTGWTWTEWDRIRKLVRTRRDRGQLPAAAHKLPAHKPRQR